MHVPLNAVTEIVNVPCSMCQKNDFPVVQTHIFGKNGISETRPFCTDCIENMHGVKHDVSIDEFEFEDDEGRTVRKRFKENKKISVAQEVDLAEELGGRVQKASGALAGSKGDVRVKGKYRIEAKFTKANSYKLLLDDLYKIISECGAGEKAVFVIDFVEKTGKLKDRFAVTYWEDFKELTNGPGNTG